MKSLKINMVNAKCAKVSEQFKSFKIKTWDENIDLEELVVKHLPKEIEDYEDFLADINIQINIKPLQMDIFKEGYQEEVSHEEECASGTKDQNQG